MKARATLKHGRLVRFFFVPLLASTLCGFSAGPAETHADAVVALCRGPIAGARHSVLLPQADGAPLSLVVARRSELPGDADCRALPTGFPVDAIVWLGAVSAGEFDPDFRIALTVRASDDKILALEVDSPPHSVRQLVPRAEVLPVRTYRVFGSEERVTAQPDVAAFDIACRPGQKPVSVILNLGAPAPEAALALELQLRASEGFKAQIVGRDQEAESQGMQVPSGALGSALILPVPRESEVALVMTCPEGEGRLRLDKGTIRPASVRPLDRPSAWVWEPEVWKSHPAELLAAATRLGFGRLYVTMSIKRGGVLEPGALANFLTAAHAASIEIVAVEGDPDMISGEGRANALARARALAAYNVGAAPQERLDGVQYDIEPYLGSGYAARSNVVWQLWAETLQELSIALGQQIDVVAPYWMLESAAAKTALEQVAPRLDRLTIMAYRTEPSAIASAAAPLLDWSARSGLGATVALELGTLAQEQRKVYVKAPEGDLHVIRFDDVAAVVVLDRVRTGSTDRAYRLSHTVLSNPARVSFDGDTRTAFAVAAEISPDLAAWPSAQGIAFHGLPEVTADAIAGSRGAR